MAERMVVILGAGASFHANAPGLKKILSEAFAAPPEETAKLDDLDKFLEEHFRSTGPDRHFPSLPLALGILDMALDRKQDLGPNWDLGRLRKVRAQVEYAIFSLLKNLTTTDLYRQLMEWLSPDDLTPTVVSTNYDLLADAAMIERAGATGKGICFPDYGCDVATKVYRDRPKYGQIFKTVGSLNWMTCPACQRLDALFYSANNMPSGAKSVFDAKLLGDAYQGLISDADPGQQPRQRTCEGANCASPMRPVIVAPTPVQELQSPHIARVRYRAERALLQADAAIFIGSAMNTSDLDLIYLLQRGLSCLPPEKITVVADAYGDVQERYCDIFGPRINWTGVKFEAWMKTKGRLADY